jgi:hypothetical protein
MINNLIERLKKYRIETLLVFCLVLVAILALITATLVSYSIGICITFILIYFLVENKRASRAEIQRLFELDNENREQLLNNAVAFNPNTVISDIITNLKYATYFVREIGAGNFDARLEGITDENIGGNKNNLAGELISMKVKMKTSAEEEKTRVWATQGLANFGDLLRNGGSDLSKLSENVLLFIINYLKANQGGIFILNEEDNNAKFLELRAAYAFERKKFLVKKISIGEGLVGQTYLEKETIYLRNIPENYVSVTSGLGGANPHALVLVPLKLEAEVLGVLEIASFKDFEKHEIAFCEKIGESIASAISAVKINERTRNLLEQSQQQSEEMRAQEEEMRQNMEELQATQEEMSRKEKDYIKRIETLQSTLKESTSNTDHETVKSLEQTIASLQKKLSEEKKSREQQQSTSPAQEATWANLEQVENDLRISLEAVQISLLSLKKRDL